MAFRNAPRSGKVITGQVDVAANILAGTGFTVVRTGVGVFVITFTPAFPGSVAPTVSPSIGNTVDGRTIKVNARSVSSVTIGIADTGSPATPRDEPFDFVAHETT